MSVGQAANTITVTSTPPANATVTGTYTPTATASSGDTVVITVDPSSSGVCSISRGVVTFNHVGNCTLDFNDPGNRLRRSHPGRSGRERGPGGQRHHRHLDPARQRDRDRHLHPDGDGQLGDAVVITVDPASSGVCSISRRRRHL